MIIYIVYDPNNTVDSLYIDSKQAEDYCSACNISSVYGGFYIVSYKTDDEQIMDSNTNSNTDSNTNSSINLTTNSLSSISPS